MKNVTILFLITAILLNINLAFALPSFYDGKPTNNTYTFGRDSDVFSISITDSNLDSTSVVHHIRVNEAGTNLTNTTASCTSLGGGNWYCSNSVSGFGSLGGDGKNFVFYYDAKNTTGDSNTSENYFVTIDRLPPQIFNNSFSNGSYISGNANLSFTINDGYSGVNTSSAKFMYGNTTFNSTFQSFTSTNPYTIAFDTRNLVNNSTYFLYANVSDNIGNVNMTRFVVYIENELPTLSIIYPVTNSTVKGINYFQTTSTDSYAGINMNSSTYILDGNSYSMPCTGTTSSATCTSPLVNSTIFSDGLKTINFSITDLAGNTRWNSTTFYIDNNPPTVSITYPTNASVLRSSFTVSATVTDLGSGTSIVQFRWENSSVGNWTSMSCSGTNCTGTFNSTNLADGNYTLKVNATDNGGSSSIQSIPIYIDNTRPNIVIVKPDVNQLITGNFLMNITITDNFALAGTATYSSGNSTGNLTCVKSTVQSYSCSVTINSSIFSDGSTSLTFTTSDLAGNSYSSSVTVLFDNFPPVVSSVTVTPQTSKTPTKFTIKGVFTDAGSSVSSATGKINLPSGKTASITFSKSGSDWLVEYTATENGKYNIDVTLVDANSHSGTYTSVGSFFVGVSKCGDGICDPTENYCTCSQDCTAPTCKDSQMVKCKTGIPTCINKTGCGNDICETDESCSTCESDCGKCAGNQTGGLDLGIVGSNLWLIILIIVVAVGGIFFYIFWSKKPKPVYPGFKPQNPS